MAKGNIRVTDDVETDVIALQLLTRLEGRRVRVIERDLTEPNRIAGEILQPGGYLKLIELGLQDCVEDIDSQRVLGYALFHDGKSIRLPYPLKKIGLDLLGKSFHNGRFIRRLREKAASLPIVQLDQGTVTSLLEENGIVKGVAYKNKNGGEYVARAHFTIVSDGCFSNLRRALCHPKPVASTINALAGTIYMVLSAPTEAKNELRRACFDYLSFGGVFMSTSMALLSRLNSDPWNLVYHFFTVALYSIGRLLFPFPSPKRLWVGARLISGGPNSTCI